MWCCRCRSPRCLLSVAPRLEAAPDGYLLPVRRRQRCPVRPDARKAWPSAVSAMVPERFPPGDRLFRTCEVSQVHWRPRLRRTPASRRVDGTAALLALACAGMAPVLAGEWSYRIAYS